STIIASVICSIGTIINVIIAISIIDIIDSGITTIIICSNSFIITTIMVEDSEEVVIITTIIFEQVDIVDLLQLHKVVLDRFQLYKGVE
ncbi:22218_t:CDS:2, partial [Cetraspora pellucida]